MHRARIEYTAFAGIGSTDMLVKRVHCNTTFNGLTAALYIVHIAAIIMRLTCTFSTRENFCHS